MENNAYVIDVGNSRIKYAEIKNNAPFDISYAQSLQELAEKIPHPSSKIAVCNVGMSHDEIAIFLSRYTESFLLQFDSKLPISIRYDTPHTLGMDRVAAAVAAHDLSGQRAALVIDIGTCMTIDVVSSEGFFEGGMISPGINLRFGAMHSYTSALPDINNEWQKIQSQLPGKSTKTAMKAGVIHGIAYELEGHIAHFKEHYGQIAVFMTGGDASLFESKLKDDIFVRPNLVLEGLIRILSYNEVI